jgi:Histone methylation protein DOT1
MSDFSDDQDRVLVHLVLQNQSTNGSIDWDAVTDEFPHTRRVARKTKLSLRNRLQTLKRTHGKDIRSFPGYFFRQPARRRCPPVPHALAVPLPQQSLSCTQQLFASLPIVTSTTAEVVQNHLPAESDDTAVDAILRQHYLQVSDTAGTQTSVGSDLTVLDVTTAPVDASSYAVPTRRLIRRKKLLLDGFSDALLGPGPTETRDPHSLYMDPRSVNMAIATIFESVTQVQVSQPSGQGTLNTGEILPLGVTKMIEVMNIGPSDVFGDIGSGTGSVVAQVALQTLATQCLGLEIRADLAAVSNTCIRHALQDFPRLCRVSILSGDVKAMSCQILETLQTCTILFCNNKVFDSADNLAVQSFMETSKARLLFLTHRFCARCHGARCNKVFCHIYENEPPIQVLVSWTATPVDMFVYRRRNVPQHTARLIDIVGDINDESDEEFIYVSLLI